MADPTEYLAKAREWFQNSGAALGSAEWLESLAALLTEAVAGVECAKCKGSGRRPGAPGFRGRGYPTCECKAGQREKRIDDLSGTGCGPRWRRLWH